MLYRYSTTETTEIDLYRPMQQVHPRTYIYINLEVPRMKLCFGWEQNQSTRVSSIDFRSLAIRSTVTIKKYTRSYTKFMVLTIATFIYA